MGYVLGIDLGTTFTAAAIHQPHRNEVVTLGDASVAVPSAVWLAEDGNHLVGLPAQNRGRFDSSRFAEYFKRDLGGVPDYLAGEPHNAADLMAIVLRWVVDLVAEREGSLPDHIALTHPANWGPFLLDAFAGAATSARLSEVSFTSEPEAAAIHYAAQERIELGHVVAVYDLGGGTFDATVLRRGQDGFEFVCPARGIERLGGLDFDEAMSNLVLDGAEIQHISSLDESEARRFREACTAAKVALSSDVEAAVEIRVGDTVREIRVTRREFEEAIRPLVADTVEAMSGVLRDAGLEPTDLDRVLLVGGSSRIPLVGSLITAELGLPVSVDAAPKNSIALGAARFAASKVSEVESAVPPDSPPPEPDPASPQAGGDVPVVLPDQHDGSAKRIAAGVGVAVVIAVIAWFFIDRSPDGNDVAGGRETSGVTENEPPPTTSKVAAPVLRAEFEPVREGPVLVERAWEFDETTARVEVLLTGTDESGEPIRHNEAMIPVSNGSVTFTENAPSGEVGNIASFDGISLEPGEQLSLSYVAAMQGAVARGDVQQIFLDWAGEREDAISPLFARDPLTAPSVSEVTGT